MRTATQAITRAIARLVGLASTRLLLVAAGASGLPAAEEGHGPFSAPSAIFGILSFVTVMVVLLKFLFPKILSAMDERTRAIREGLEAADRARAEAAAMIAQHESDLAKARAEGAAIVEEAKSDAVKLKDSILASARHDAEAISARARREIEQAKHSAIDELHRQSAALSLEIASALIKKNLTLEDQQQLIDERLKEFKFGAN